MTTNSTSQWGKWLSDPGQIRAVSIEATALMQQLCRQQNLTGVAQQGYAEAVVGTMLIASAHKSGESINMNAQGSGVFKQAIVDASPDGRVRGFLIEEKDPSMHTYGAEGHNGPWGSGVLSILYTKNFERKVPYTGMVPISTGFLDFAINEYYLDSEQLTSKVGLFVEFKDETLIAARGALLQCLGGATDEELETVKRVSLETMRRLAQKADHFDQFIHETSLALGGVSFRLMETKPLVGFCNCSQERIERALVLTGEDDAMYALGEDAFITMTCDFCRKEYKVSRERVKSLFSRDPSRLQ